MFKVLIDNKEYFYQSINFTEKFNSLANECNASFMGEYNFNFNNKFVLKNDNVVLLSGFIDSLDINKSGTSISTNISCRDITGDIIDSTMRVISRKKNYNFLTLIKEITSLEVINKSNVTNFSIPYQVKSSVGQSLSDFLNEIAKTFKVFLSCDASGKILISSLNTSASKPYVIKEYISFRKSESVQDLYNRYTCYSQTDFKKNSLLAGQVSDSSIRNNRFFVFESETTLETTKQAQSLADRRKQLNNASQKYIDIEIPFSEILHVNSYVEFEKNIYFLDEITYNISDSKVSLKLKLVDKNVYL